VADELLLAGAEVVIDRNAGTCAGKPVDYVASDKASPSSYECPVHLR